MSGPRAADDFATIRARLEELRREPRTLRTPVVVITGSGIADSALMLAQGAQAFLQKPFEPNELIEIVSKLVGR